MTRISVSKSESSTETSKSSTKDTKSPAEDSKSSKKIQSTKVSTSLSLEQNYNMWKLIHQSVADKGFEWAAPTSHYLDGNMPKNTNFVSVQNAMLQEYLQELIKEGSTAQDRKYDSCIFDALSQKTLSTKILRSTAKSCAKSAYGTYFTGKEYTTREEVLMLLSRYYNTPYAIQ